MEEGNRKESHKKIIEPLINVPKPRQNIHHQQIHHQQKPHNVNNNCTITLVGNNVIPGLSKYGELLHVIEELGQHIRPSYTGHKGSAEKIKQGIVKARVLVRECLIEAERSARQ